jgi:hypothetical protein
MLKTLGRFVILFILQTIGAQVQLKPKPLEGIEGRNITVTCSFPENTTDILLYVGGRLITGIGSKFLGLTVGRTAVEYGYGPLEASDDGVVFECDNTAGSTDSATLRLLVPPEYSVNPSLSTTVLEGTSEYSYQFTFVGYPVPTNFTWRRGSEEISNSTRITITVNSITIRNVSRSDSGFYVVTATSITGVASANFTLTVQCPPVLLLNVSGGIDIDPSCTRQILLSKFVPDCALSNLSFSCDGNWRIMIVGNFAVLSRTSCNVAGPVPLMCNSTSNFGTRAFDGIHASKCLTMIVISCTLSSWYL